MEVLKVPLFILILLAVYVAPLTLVGGAALRTLAPRLSHARRTMGLAGFLGLAQTLVVLYWRSIMFADWQHGPLWLKLLLGACLILTGAGWVLWWRSMRGAAWIEPVLALFIAAGWLMSVNNWIVG